MSAMISIVLNVNGVDVARAVEPRTTLADFLRQDLELTGVHVGCEMGSCGACLVLMDDRPVHACLTFAAQAACGRVETIEGLTARGAIADLQQAFHQRNALQCGYCTPGMLMTAYGLLRLGRSLRARKFATRCPAIIAAAPATKRSSTRSRRRRGRAQDRRPHVRPPDRRAADSARPSQLLIGRAVARRTPSVCSRVADVTWATCIAPRRAPPSSSARPSRPSRKCARKVRVKTVVSGQWPVVRLNIRY